MSIDRLSDYSTVEKILLPSNKILSGGLKLISGRGRPLVHLMEFTLGVLGIHI